MFVEGFEDVAEAVEFGFAFAAAAFDGDGGRFQRFRRRSLALLDNGRSVLNRYLYDEIQFVAISRWAFAMSIWPLQTILWRRFSRASFTRAFQVWP